jgi:uncharacterized membrane protein YkvI
LLQSSSTAWRVGSFALPFARFEIANGARGKEMKNPLDSLWGTIISGLVLTVILYFIVKNLLA